MQLVLWGLRNNRKGIAGHALLVLVLVGAVAAGTILLFQNDTVKIEGRLHDVGFLQDPIPAKFDVVITNLGGAELLVDHVVLKLWADPEQTILLTEGEVRNVHVGPGETKTVTVDLLIQNGSYFTDTVWVDADFSWYEGSHRNGWQGTRAIRVSDVLSSFN